MIDKKEEYQSPHMELLLIQYECSVLANSIEDVEEDFFGEF